MNKRKEHFYWSFHFIGWRLSPLCSSDYCNRHFYSYPNKLPSCQDVKLVYSKVSVAIKEKSSNCFDENNDNVYG